MGSRAGIKEILNTKSVFIERAVNMSASSLKLGILTWTSPSVTQHRVAATTVRFFSCISCLLELF